VLTTNKIINLDSVQIIKIKVLNHNQYIKVSVVPFTLLGFGIFNLFLILFICIVFLYSVIGIMMFFHHILHCHGPVILFTGKTK
jgi:hypothetical protein